MTTSAPTAPTAPAAPAAPAAGPGTSPSGTTPKKSNAHNMFNLFIGNANRDTVTQLNALAKQLGCRVQALMWDAARQYLLNPPKAAPAGTQGRAVGSAAGFWTVPLMDPKDPEKCIGFKVVEVENRKALSARGRCFFRYDVEDEKSRGRAERQAVRNASSDLQFLRLPSDKVSVERLKSRTPALSPA
jgi:hypothetical protein